ncbi:nitrilase-related carbon-nitrogen hydrolase [Lichenibacterium ramalinae]|uniref:Acyltransferase n=1 Tax=Lichenibacterium ramalinae TaxID=2316527 RepID=A0A4Q2REC3_9HYPH|nr:nitrilase-related carbon-nitrogen hydrolase [Lichenibacterium ramalinae]RYB03697.1 acyltransferase [Lichenibacterium ramalinae]
MPSQIRVATVQFEHRADDKAYNLGRVEALAREARAAGAEIVAFPEMCIGGYWHVPGLVAAEVEGLAEPVDGPSVSQVAALARELGLGIGVGWLEAGAEGRIYNAYRLCLPDGSGHTHRKLHAFEHPRIASGAGFTVFDTPWGVRVAILICWDNNLIENVRACALMGAEVLLAPHQTGGTRSLSPHGMKPIPLALWERRHEDPEPLRAALAGPDGRGWLMRWLPSRAHDNGLFVVFSNGIGADMEEVRTGNAMILDPYGRVVAESTAIEDDVVVADLALDLIPTSSGRRWMRGRRPDLYGIIAETRGDETSARATRFGDDA